MVCQCQITQSERVKVCKTQMKTAKVSSSAKTFILCLFPPPQGMRKKRRRMQQAHKAMKASK